MQTFYRLRETPPGLAKAEALRQAQLQLLGGPGSRLAESQPARGLKAIPEQAQESAGVTPRFVPQPQAPYAHPYYWAPFVLMGNWQ